MKTCTSWLLAAASAAAFLAIPLAQAQSAPPPAPQTDLPRSTLHVGSKALQVQRAESDRERAIGLMSRTSLGADEGMLFVFPDRAVQCFWMRNTLIPLNAAFIADDGRIVNVADMQPLSDDPHCSAQPVRYVLEAAQGWFAQAGAKAGSKIKGLPMAPKDAPSSANKAQKAATAPNDNSPNHRPS
jgi:hypothetical protein